MKCANNKKNNARAKRAKLMFSSLNMEICDVRIAVFRQSWLFKLHKSQLNHKIRDKKSCPRSINFQSVGKLPLSGMISLSLSVIASHKTRIKEN